MRAILSVTVLFAMTLTTLGYLGCSLLTDIPVREPGLKPVYHESGFLTRTRAGVKEIYLPHSPFAWHPLASSTESPPVRSIRSPMKPDFAAVLHENGSVTITDR